MPNSPPSQAADNGLVYVDDSLPGIRRKRRRNKWVYSAAEGTPITDVQEIARLNAIALPPAYEDAWFCPAANGHILATGYDARGRKQYRYHPQFREMRDGEKFDRCLAFGNLLPLLRKRVELDMAAPQLTQERAVACVVRLLDLGRIRIGNSEYTKQNKSFGATTLRHRHVRIEGGEMRLTFKGKSGQLRNVTLKDKGLARFASEVQDLPGQQLFQYVDDDGENHQVTSGDVNAYIRHSMGEDFTAKNFRTFHASVLAFATLASGKEDLPIKVLLEVVSDRLGNTPAVARKSYIHPAVIDLVERQTQWRAGLRLPRKTRWLTREERGLLAMLEDSPAAAELMTAA
ncbi:DNA topoisomerase IB [Croceicoccus sp. F390]|uniref:DNA topoisomerase n=1 Tax=Croceicoccus esteveae TaxID=3075597 RepID=A0ABU2ZJN8_9SPHN|nr:DNA topoisomerase IB [Croceicoccus sp. F390]MDT0576600.1 DNA topoisomerase IB [Croceicoccus sp. F390]